MFQTSFSNQGGGLADTTVWKTERRKLAKGTSQLELARADSDFRRAGVAQLIRARPCQGRGREFESHHPHQFNPKDFRAV